MTGPDLCVVTTCLSAAELWRTLVKPFARKPDPATTRGATASSRIRAVVKRVRTRRGVAAVLAMMFLILFGSLAAAMAVASTGNIKTAATHLHVGRAQSAAETGLAIARARLSESANRFVVSRSNVDADFGRDLWNGAMGDLGSVTVVPPRTGRQDLSTPGSLAAAVAQLHGTDAGVVESLGVLTPTIGNARAGADTAVFASSNWVYTPGVVIEPSAGDGVDPALCYQVTYAPLANGTDIRVISTGYDFGYARSGTPISRTISQDFRLRKGVRHAIVSSSRVMIGKNVMIKGDVGTRYSAVNFNNADPLVTRSDFAGMDARLDQKLADFFTSVDANDVDGDNRLRVGHPVEGAGIPPGTADYDGDGRPDNAFADATDDGYVDELDIFIRHYDRNGDNRVTLSSTLTAGTPAAGLANEFVDSSGQPVDEDLAVLIDSNNMDRNRNGIYGFQDANGNGRWDNGELMVDIDPADGTARDQVLGFRDGFIDKKDQYAKVQGGMKFRVSESAWTTSQGNIDPKLRGPVVAPTGTPPRSFSLSDAELPSVDTSVFTASRTALQNAADGAGFSVQAAQNLGITVAQLATYSAARPADQTAPWYRRVDATDEATGLPSNASSAYWERMPFNSPSFSDVFYRPVFYNMTFKDVQIPAGTNALFVNCTFIGVTYVRTTTANTNLLWGEYGRLTVTAGNPALVSPRFIYTGTAYPTMLPSTAIPPNQNVVMAVTPLDKGDVPSTQTSRPGYNALPEPLVWSGRRVIDTKPLSNNLRFHDCLFVGSIVSDVPSVFTQTRNKVQFTGATRFLPRHPTQPDNAGMNPESADQAEIAKSSMMLANYSVDVGSFNSPPAQNLNLSGAIIAGVLDARGNVNVDGSLMLTYSPVQGQGPLRDSSGAPIGNPANFNTTLGYFGPDDGDSEALDPLTLPVVNGTRIVGWDTDGDGLADVAHTQPQPAGSTPVAFNGFGRITIRFNPNMTLPDGIMLPMQIIPVAGTYKEGKQ
jgi:hypothetical protein